MVTLALTVFGWDLPSEPHFVDESAYISQSSFSDLLIRGQVDDPTWLTYAGYDLPPLPKYLIGISLRIGGYRRPPPAAIWEWYANTSRRFVPGEALTVARIPSVLLGTIGVLAIYAIGTMAAGRWAGLIAGLLLIANPLYGMHARRAMSDVPAEALILSTLALGLWSWRRLLAGRGRIAPGLGLAVGAGVFCGLSTLSKLNGALGGFILAAWAALGLCLKSFPVKGRSAVVLATMTAGAIAFATFAALNPFLYAHPRGPIDPRLEPLARMTFAERVGVVYRHRSTVSIEARSQFPDDALMTPIEKVKAVAIQGFGRFGPFGPRGRSDSTVRYDWGQDWGGTLWLPWVALGLVASVRLGLREYRAGKPPGAWAVVVQSVVALVVVTSFIPLAWDRYFLSIQPGSALLGAIGASEIIGLIGRTIFGMPRTESTP